MVPASPLGPAGQRGPVRALPPWTRRRPTGAGHGPDLGVPSLGVRFNPASLAGTTGVVKLVECRPHLAASTMGISLQKMKPELNSRQYCLSAWIQLCLKALTSQNCIYVICKQSILTSK